MERINTRIDPKGLASGEFGDTLATNLESQLNRLPYNEQFIQDRLAEGLSIENARKEWNAFVQCFGD